MALRESPAACATQSAVSHSRSPRRAWQGLNQENLAICLQGGNRLRCRGTVAKYPEHRGAAARHEDSFRPQAQQRVLESGEWRVGGEDGTFQIVDQQRARGPLTGGELRWLR